MTWTDLGGALGQSPKKKPKKKAAKKKKSAKKKAAAKPKKKAKKKRARKKLPTAEAKEATACNRSPCGPYDPKVDFEEIEAARQLVARQAGRKLKRAIVLDKEGQPRGTWHKKKGQRGKGDFKPKYRKTTKVHRPERGKPLAVAYGLGVDSTAILVGLVQEHRRNPRGGFRPDVITFADTGAEKQATYDYLELMNAYLEQNDFPPVTVVSYFTQFTSNSWGSAETLEQQILVNQSGPSITEFFGAKSKCSSLWKQAPQDLFMKHASGLWEQVTVRKKGSRAKKAWRPIDGLIVKAIGYDATEERRMAPDGGGTGATYRTGKDDGYRYWYPLVEWGWDRARCRAEIENEIGMSPPKSSCFFCFAMKPEEVVSLSLDEARRAVFLELVRRHGRQSHRYAFKKKHGLLSKSSKGVQGLAGKWSWTDLYVNGAMKTLDGIYSEERRAAIDAKVLQDHGRPTLLTNVEVRRLDKLAAQFVARSADKGRSLQVSELEAAGKAPTRKNRVDKAFKGQSDLSLDPWVRKLPAWSDLKGFRGTDDMTWIRKQRDNPLETSGFTSDTLNVPTDLYGIAYPIG